MANRKKRAAGRGSQPDFSKPLLRAALAAAVLGLGLSGYATRLSLRIAGQGIAEPSGCTINDFVSCDYAFGSSYGKLFDIPVSWWGFLFFAFTALAVLYGAFGANRRSAGGMISLAWILSLVSSVVVLWKAYHLLRLDVVCLVCMGMYASVFAIAALLPAALRSGGARTLLTGWISAARGGGHTLAFDPAVSRWALLAVVVFGLGWVVLRRQVVAVEFGAGVDVEQAVRAHFRVQPVDVQVHEDAAVWGNPQASVQVVEFADFQCPACQQSAFHLRAALFEYRDRIQLRFMHFPLDSTVNESMTQQNHANAGPAAKAAVCAAEFGDFWDYHDELFRNQSVLSSALYERLAEKRGWDVARFEACMQRDDVLARLRSDIAAGVAARLQYTPSIYINGRYVAYWQNSNVIHAILDEELRRAG